MEVRGAIAGFHGGVSEKGQFINGFDFFGGGCIGFVKIAVAADDGPRFGGVVVHSFADADRGLGGGRRLVPFNLEKLAGLHGGPRGIGDDGNAGARVIAAAGAGRFTELMGEMRGL